MLPPVHDSEDPTLILRRILFPALSPEPPRDARILFPYERNTLLIQLDSIVHGQLLPDPANRPRAGIQESVVPSLQLGDRRWCRERKGRQCKVGMERIWGACTWVLRNPCEPVL